VTERHIDRLARNVLLPSFRSATCPDWLARALSSGAPGIMLIPENYDPDTGSYAPFVAQLRQHNDDPLIASDEEGGEITRLWAHTTNPLPGAAVLGRAGEPLITRAVHASLGSSAANAGINLVLGPVADVNTDARNPVIGARAFGSDPALVEQHTVAAVLGLRDGGVASCVKHFPGHGGVAADSHHTSPVFDGTLRDIETTHLPPFAAAVRAGTDAVMTGHVIYPALDNRPASTSRTAITHLLRHTLGFDGVAITDAVDMEAARSDRAHPAVTALAAGNDLVCLGPSTTQSTYREAVTAIRAAVVAGLLTIDELEQSAQRVNDLTARRRHRSTCTPLVRDWAWIADAAIDIVNGPLPDLRHYPLKYADLSSTAAEEGRARDLGTREGDGPAFDGVVLVARDLPARPGQWNDIKAALSTYQRVVVIETGWPADDSEWVDRTGSTVTRIRTWSNSDLSDQAAARLMREAVDHR
jgi:beta-N-acetylhexosaminidase